MYNHCPVGAGHLKRLQYSKMHALTQVCIDRGLPQRAEDDSESGAQGSNLSPGRISLILFPRSWGHGHTIPLFIPFPILRGHYRYGSLTDLQLCSDLSLLKSQTVCLICPHLSIAVSEGFSTRVLLAFGVRQLFAV